MKLLEELIPTNLELFTDLIRKMLIIDPAKRLSAAKALQHPFLT
jgi:serine/threonine protein kinase